MTQNITQEEESQSPEEEYTKEPKNLSRAETNAKTMHGYHSSQAPNHKLWVNQSQGTAVMMENGATGHKPAENRNGGRAAF